MNLTELGFTQDELQNRIVNNICDRLMSTLTYDADDGEYYTASPLKKLLDDQIKKQIDLSISALAEKHVLPNIAALIEGLSLQETNKWGEKTGKQLTFIEFLVERSTAYIEEKVDSSGKSRTEAQSSYWTGTQTRLAFMINSHLEHNIKQVMAKIIADSNTILVKSLQDTAKEKLSEISAALKVAVTTK